MKPYKGIIKISCTKKTGCLRNLHKDVEPGCMDCPAAVTEILNIEGKKIFTYKSPPERTGKRTTKEASKATKTQRHKE